MKYINLGKNIKNILVVLILFVSFGVNTIFINAKENNVIRVGYPSVPGFTEKNDGAYSGYVYDYLREISIYTGWEYEFVEMDLATALDALRDGDIDILAGMLKNDQTMEIYDFPKYNSGYTYTTLVTLKDNEKFNISDYVVLEDMKIGYFETAQKSLNNFMEFCSHNDIRDINLSPYPHTEGLLLEKLKAKEVDAIITGDLLIDSEEKVLARFGATPQYFATTKGNTEILEGLNYALSNIKTRDTDFEDSLYKKYFQSNYDYTPILAREEVEYIQNMKPLKAIYIDNFTPLQYYDSHTKQPKGIFVDTIRLISQKLGIPVEFVPAKTYEGAYQMLKDKKGDIIAGVSDDYSVADQYDFLLTKHYLNLDLMKIVNKDRMNQETKEIIALADGNGLINSSDDFEIAYYDTPQEAIMAVNEGRATTTYANSYSIANYVAEGYYNNLSILSDDSKMRVAIGLSKSMDEQLMNILHKAVYSLSDQELLDVINANTLHTKHTVSLKEFFIANLELSLFIIMVVLGIIGTLIFIVIKMKFDKMKETKRILFEKTQIDSLTGVNNREACEQLVTEYLKTKDESLYATFIIIDIDHFKQINDRFGHKIGDKLLIEFSSLLKEFFSLKDIVSRLGGDEFIVFMKDINEKDIEKIHNKLQELCEIMDKEIVHNGHSQKISLSVGAVVTQQAIEFGELYSLADETLYEVKHNGRNGFKIKTMLRN